MIALSRYNPRPTLTQGESPWSSDRPGELITYDPDAATLPAALENLERQHYASGLETALFLSEQGWVVRFLWPDWPRELSQKAKKEVDAFHDERPELSPIPEDSKEWETLSRGMRSDPASAEKLSACFDRHLPGRVDWARCEKDARGVIEAKCGIANLGVAAIRVSWRSFAAYPPGPYNSYQEMRAYQNAVRDVFAWARSRIKTILDTLDEKLKALYGDRFKGLYVFGSYARPDAGIELSGSSDLDVALILSDFENPADERERFGAITADLSLEHDLVISVVPIREADYREKSSNFVRVISQYAVPVP